MEKGGREVLKKQKQKEGVGGRVLMKRQESLTKKRFTTNCYCLFFFNYFVVDEYKISVQNHDFL